MKKYELLKNDTVTSFGKTLYRIKAVRSFGNVEKGQLGGYIEKELNLSHKGNAWVFGNAKVFDNAMVFGNARVFGDAEVFDNAKVCDDAHVYDNAQVYDNAMVFGNAWVFGNAQVLGNAWVFGDTRVSSGYFLLNWKLTDNNHHLVISNIGSENGVLTVFKSEEGSIEVNRGCFSGTLKEFEEAVKSTHGDNQYGRQYKATIEYIKQYFL